MVGVRNQPKPNDPHVEPTAGHQRGWSGLEAGGGLSVVRVAVGSVNAGVVAVVPPQAQTKQMNTPHKLLAGQCDHESAA